MGIADGQAANALNLNAAFADKNFQTIAAGTNFTIVNNQSSPANITGFLFDKTAYRSIAFSWQVYRKSTGGSGQIRVQRGRAMIYHNDTSWVLVQESMSPTDAGVVLDVDPTSGQITYISDNDPGTYSSVTSVLSYQIEQTMRL